MRQLVWMGQASATTATALTVVTARSIQSNAGDLISSVICSRSGPWMYCLVRACHPSLGDMLTAGMVTQYT
jgi:hypothetical protein